MWHVNINTSLKDSVSESNLLPSASPFEGMISFNSIKCHLAVVQNVAGNLIVWRKVWEEGSRQTGTKMCIRKGWGEGEGGKAGRGKKWEEMLGNLWHKSGKRTRKHVWAAKRQNRGSRRKKANWEREWEAQSVSAYLSLILMMMSHC